MSSRCCCPSLDSEMRLGFDRLLERAGVRPILLAEVDDMAMLRLLARESGGVALVPPIVVRDELEAGGLVELVRIPELVENFYAIVQKRRFPNPLARRTVAGAAYRRNGARAGFDSRRARGEKPAAKAMNARGRSALVNELRCLP